MKQTLFIDQGTDWAANVLITAFDGTPVNVAGWVFNGVVRKEWYAPLSSANLTITVVSAANGSINLSMNAATTANLEQGRYVYTVTQKNSANQTSILQDGFLIINPSALATQPTPQAVIFPQVLPNTSYINQANTDQYV